MQASKNYELFCKRKINLHCHTLIFFIFIGSFTQTCLGLLEAFSWCPFFFGPIRPLVNESSKSRYLEFSPGVISLSPSLVMSKITLSRTFCPVPSEFEIARLDCIVIERAWHQCFLAILNIACNKKLIKYFVIRVIRDIIIKIVQIIGLS